MIASDFSLPDQNNRRRSLSEFRGKWVVLYFYPRDDTPGCTTEACSFRDSFHKLEKAGAVIVGVSKDSVESHRKFSAKYNLNFPLLSDPEKKVIQAYEAWGAKKFMGKEFDGTLRMSYLIDPKGEIKKVYEKVNPTVHAGQIFDDLEAMK